MMKEEADTKSSEEDESSYRVIFSFEDIARELEMEYELSRGSMMDLVNDVFNIVCQRISIDEVFCAPKQFMLHKSRGSKPYEVFLEIEASKELIRLMRIGRDKRSRYKIDRDTAIRYLLEGD